MPIPPLTAAQLESFDAILFDAIRTTYDIVSRSFSRVGCVVGYGGVFRALSRTKYFIER